MITADSKHFKMKPWDHQLEGINRAIAVDNFAWLYEVGTGKTKTAVETLRVIFSRYDKVVRTLVVCPPIVIANWPKEFRLSSNISSDDIVCLVGTGKKRLETFKKAKPDSIFICNYETLAMKGFMEEVKRLPFEIVVSDEVHYCKNSTAKRSKNLYAIGDRAKCRYALTGTPILNSSLDVFGIWRFLDKGESFGTNYYGFRSRYFYDANARMNKDNHFPKWVPIESMSEELSSKMAKISQHVKKEECLDLPPYHRVVVNVPLSKEQQRAYDEMKKDLITFLDSGDKAAIAKLALTKALRLLQITSGFVGTENVNGEKSDHVFKKTPRATELKELLLKTTPNHKVIIWSVFKQNYETIRQVCEEIGVDYVEVNGGVSQKKKDEAVERFENDPAVRVFSGHPISGGIGINLVAGSYTIYFSRGFSLGADLQSEARNYRGGSEIHKQITRIDLVTPGTIDEAVLKKLKEKVDVSSTVLKALRNSI